MYLEKKWFQFFVLIILGFIWGSSFILMKTGLKSFSNDQVAAMRILFASLTMMPLAFRNLKILRGKELKSLLIAGFIGSFIPAFLFTKAQTRIDSALAGMLNSLTPIFTLLVGIVFYKMKFKWQHLLGLSFGLTGALGLISSGSTISIDNINIYVFFVIGATLCYAISVNEIKTNLTHLNGFQVTSLSFFFLGPVALIYLLTTDLSVPVQNTTWGYHLMAIIALGIIGTSLAMLIMNTIIRHISALFASSVTYIIPVFAIMWGLLDGEQITAFHFVFIGIILLGVYLIRK